MNFRNFPFVLFASSKITDGNMSFVYGEKSEVINARNKFAKKFDIGSENFSVLRLEHKDKVVEVSRKDSGKEFVADSIITTDNNFFIGVLSADCLPIAIFDPKTKTIALVHLSIKNYSSVIDKTINALMHYHNVNFQDLIVEIGPSIGPCHYKMDLWKKAEDILVRNNIKRKNIQNRRICTYEDNYFSHRRSVKSGETEGRLLTFLGITK